jgi:hypothetical protein
VTDQLDRIARRDWQLVLRRPSASPTTSARRKFGSVGDAVVAVFTEARSDLRAIEVHAGVEEVLGVKLRDHP